MRSRSGKACPRTPILWTPRTSIVPVFITILFKSNIINWRPPMGLRRKIWASLAAVAATLVFAETPAPSWAAEAGPAPRRLSAAFEGAGSFAGMSYFLNGSRYRRYDGSKAEFDRHGSLPLFAF